MDAAAFERVYGAFQDFHAYFAALFGRRETRDHSRHYLQALLVQSGERRNAENLSETVPASARAMQRFLAESPWDDDLVIGRLQEYLVPRLGHPEGVWVLDGSDFPKQGVKSVGVARQYCGRLGKVANCQAGMFLAYVSPLGRALVDKGLYLPESLSLFRVFAQPYSRSLTGPGSAMIGKYQVAVVRSITPFAQQGAVWR